MKRAPLVSVCVLLACAERNGAICSGVGPALPASLTAANPVVVPPEHIVLESIRWSIRAFPQASISVALPENGIELNAKDLGQTQALLAVGVQVKGYRGPQYTLLVYPLSNPLVGASLEQRLYLLPHLLRDLGPHSRRRPVDLEGLPGVEFVTEAGSSVQRARVFATPTRVVALIVKGSDPNQTTDGAARLFFVSLQWYDEPF